MTGKLEEKMLRSFQADEIFDQAGRLSEAKATGQPSLGLVPLCIKPR
jgi:hypothetical protein